MFITGINPTETSTTKSVALGSIGAAVVSGVMKTCKYVQ